MHKEHREQIAFRLHTDDQAKMQELKDALEASKWVDRISIWHCGAVSSTFWLIKAASPVKPIPRNLFRKGAIPTKLDNLQLKNKFRPIEQRRIQVELDEFLSLEGTALVLGDQAA